jgi:diadenosine tetraphosphatase ApaH/serine/threonine PP2A family protein phosphatase
VATNRDLRSLAIRTSRGTGGEDIHFLNAGSIGKPKDGDPRAGYVLLIEADEDVRAIDLVRVEHDVERAVEGILRSKLPNEFAEQPRVAGTSKAIKVP